MGALEPAHGAIAPVEEASPHTEFNCAGAF